MELPGEAMNLVLVFHAHQPLENDQGVVARLTDQCYRPFLTRLAGAPHVRCGIHVSGPLLLWWRRLAPDLLTLLKDLVVKKQIELLLSGFHEPILAAIASPDRQGQIRLMRRFLSGEFHAPSLEGLWLTERVWEPSLPEDLAQVGVTYVLVDDHHFLVSGWKPEEMYAPFLTEHGGHRLAVLPVIKQLRYLIPFRPVDQLEAFVKGNAGRPLIVYGDDMEKFGAWPGTAKWVYEDGWLKSFFDWLKTVSCALPMEALAACPPERLCYLPTASYAEMEEWTLPPEGARELHDLRAECEAREGDQYLRGGIWPHFFVKYSEANWMHKRVAALSEQVRRAHHPDPNAMEAVYAAQGNDAYWHGVFGGLYLPHLRRGIWKYIARAERLVNRQSSNVQVSDIDVDGREEALIRTPWMSAAIKIDEASVWDCLSLDHEANLLNVLTRRPERYHEEMIAKLVKREGQSQPQAVKGVSSIHERKLEEVSSLERLVYDSSPRVSGLTYLWGHEASHSREGFEASRLSNRLPRRGWKLVRSKGAAVEMVWGDGEVTATKMVSVEKGGELVVHFSVRPSKEESLHAMVGMEWNLEAWDGNVIQFPPPHEAKRFSLESRGSVEGVSSVAIERGPGKVIRLRLEPEGAGWFFPIVTFSQSEEGAEQIIQGLAIMCVWPFVFGRDGTCRVTAALRMGA